MSLEKRNGQGLSSRALGLYEVEVCVDEEESAKEERKVRKEFRNMW